MAGNGVEGCGRRQGQRCKGLVRLGLLGPCRGMALTLSDMGASGGF